MRDDLPHAMRETARRLEPDVGRLTAGGVSRGTRMRRLERAAQVLGSAVAVTVVFAGVTIFGTHGGAAHQQTNQPAASETGSEGESSPPTMVGTPTTPTATTATSSSTAYVTRTQLIAALKTGLSGSGVTASAFVARGSDSNPASTVAAGGTILVEAQLSAGKNVGYLGIVFAGPRNLVPHAGTPRLRPDGSVVYVSKGSGSSDGRQLDRTALTVTLVRPDGGSSLSATETNSPNEKSPAASNGAPLLLSADQLGALLDSSLWDDAVAAAGTLPPTAGQPGSTMPSAAMSPS